MAYLVYIDESAKTSGRFQDNPQFLLTAAIVSDRHVAPMAQEIRRIAREYGPPFGKPAEIHAKSIVDGSGQWRNLSHERQFELLQRCVDLLGQFEIDIAFSSINRGALKSRYGGAFDSNEYLLALQFLLEKVDKIDAAEPKLVVADLSEKDRLSAISMVGDLQEWGAGAVPGIKLASIVDSLHFVDSRDNPGVQLVDVVAWCLQRRWCHPTEKHPLAESSMGAISAKIWDRIVTYREAWPK